MSAFIALLRREWLESRTTYLIAIVGLLGLITLGGGLATLIATSQSASVISVTESIDRNGNIERHERITDRLADFADFSSWTDRELSQRLSTLRLGVSSAFHSVFFAVIIFVLLNCLYDERRDRSILFWKSMPVRDEMTIASKLIAPVWLVALLVVAAIVLSWILLLSLLSLITISADLGSVSRLWAQSGLLTGILQELVGYTIQGLWSLPLYGWLLLVSVSASRLPLLWAVLIPMTPVFCERVLLGSNYVGGFITRHLEFAALPRLLSNDNQQTPDVQSLGDQLALLLSGDLWLGVGIGLILLGATVWCYQRNNEL